MIPELVLPDHMKAILVGIGNILNDCSHVIKPDKNFSGLLLPKLSKSQRKAMTAFEWMGSEQEVFDNLNIIISDLRELPIRAPSLPGSPATRFTLLIRTYFHEIYRTRELFSHYLNVLRLWGCLEKSEVIKFRTGFNSAFKGIYEMRNSLVHMPSNWDGQEHFNLFVFDAISGSRDGLRDRKIDDSVQYAQVLSPLCSKRADALESYGVGIQATLQNILNTTCELLRMA